MLVSLPACSRCKTPMSPIKYRLFDGDIEDYQPNCACDILALEEIDYEIYCDSRKSTSAPEGLPFRAFGRGDGKY